MYIGVTTILITGNNARQKMKYIKMYYDQVYMRKVLSLDNSMCKYSIIIFIYMYVSLERRWESMCT